MAENEAKGIVLEFWARMQSNDFHHAAALLAEEYLLDWPLTGERIRGRSGFVALNQAYPAYGQWRFTIDRCLAEANQVVTDVSVTDGMQSARALTFSTVENGQIVRQVEYWPEPYAAPPWRQPYVERLA